ncbi:16S rRNA (cytosine(967)-C(5))-methyltransferase RsmB [Pluralibacter gergoviae]|uniref:Ribosomal RNA small subunit methyltransferase B n=1 Tax=Pluralibacter gergoviae TaxID=61647 RepID=A0AAW8HMI3_PLUGE|nr:16S rRNA (cytosine(967)-C(5))-methyltransferase RsmB [Pluralibacter gergoviae]AVR02259.1 16S rRNA (cytosine(967)-C(5))-methyltransferase RsmB [Pluralibacter gergoviae]EKT9640488.1 16S rRNA (cytosine(967)-C(5))-methyltransferase RsmB [Pluralibacter gergoviae]EKV3543032.1 16S rRNA (cytosine(967)-C(5))-methyltransferase RsmB [Pluralibacter gergoviae]EKV9897852.1 16S rRNA (cytosine(967)-C(5))-methyltransferase RsmB [Pluralibacter gergoviae]EKV9929056.1 16S rRNA (cytosine(967)-C(5))-methyltransf
MKKNPNLRSLVAQSVEQVVEQGQSLSSVLPVMQKKVAEKDRALLQELSFGVLRTLPQLEWLINKLMSRPMTGKQRTVHYLIMVGFYQLLYTRIPPHAALAETVEGAVAIKRPQLKGLINGVLRQFQRQQEELLAEFAGTEKRFLHPEWLVKRLKKAYPQQWQQILEANNQRPPMWLRVNRNHHSRDEWLALLEAAGMTGAVHPDYPDAVRLDAPAPVQALPGFAEGWVTVQDASAQGCMRFLQPKNGEAILDLCAAPGGKTTHILEVAPEAAVLAVDVDEQRLSRVYDNLKRLGMKAEVKQGDGRTPAQWCGEKQFDRILLDAPCSATGVIRRHPDIKWLRRDRDIPELVRLQGEILDAIWPHLKPGGTLVYATCSVLPEENSQQIAAFLQRTADARLEQTCTPEKPGQQNLPDAAEGDGFFYATLIKQ